jgi:hypothetical protein
MASVALKSGRDTTVTVKALSQDAERRCNTREAGRCKDTLERILLSQGSSGQM